MYLHLIAGVALGRLQGRDMRLRICAGAGRACAGAGGLDDYCGKFMRRTNSWKRGPATTTETRVSHKWGLAALRLKRLNSYAGSNSRLITIL